MSKSFSVIDIGSNSIRYMEASYSDHSFHFSKKESYTTRLAAGISSTGLLSKKGFDDSVEVISALYQKSSAKGLPCFAYATSAVRDAENKALFIDAVHQICALPIDVLSGEDEARLARIGADCSGGMIDIGGGSTQVSTRSFKKSYPLGCVRIKDYIGNFDDLSSVRASLPAIVERIFLFPDSLSEDLWVGVGGTITTLGALSVGADVYDPSLFSDLYLSKNALESLLITLDSIGSEGRRKIPLLQKRYDVILGGGYLLLLLMDRLHIDSLKVSDRDGLEGYAIHIFQKFFSE